MNIFIINASPKGEKSNTLILTNSFIEGIKEKILDVDLRKINLSDSNIKPCTGCFSCWKTTQGSCFIKDDMDKVIENILWADLIVWSFPLYYFNVPSILKSLIDRQLPMNLPFMQDNENENASGSHPSRYDMTGKKHILISTCGFYSARGNYDSVLSMFDHILGVGKYESIFCGQGELFNIKEVSSRTVPYLQIIKKAGKEYVTGGILSQTKEKLQEPLFPKDIFEKMADTSWGVEKEDFAYYNSPKKSEQKSDESYIFTKQMANLYNTKSFDGKVRVLQMDYTDKNISYQIKLDEKKATVSKELLYEPTTTIVTAFSLWQAISRNEIRGDVALSQGKYSVKGNLEILMRWNDFFGTDSLKNEQKEELKTKKNPTMLYFLIPWTLFWILISIDAKIGAIITLAVNLCLPFIFKDRENTLYDSLSLALVGFLCIGIIIDIKYYNICFIASYIIFAFMWLGSLLTKVPLSANYVKYKYYGQDSLENPIFMKTNAIIVAGWGLLYVIITIATFFMLKYGIGKFAWIINSIAPIFMGIFTAWFPKFYPAYVARGKKIKN